MTPATSSQMSRSSSTIRISSAIFFSVLPVPDPSGNRFTLPCYQFLPLARQRPQPPRMQGQRHACALSRRIGAEVEFAIMLLDDLLDDRESQPGAALPRRHMGFGDRIAGLRQPDPVVADPDDDGVA